MWDIHRHTQCLTNFKFFTIDKIIDFFLRKYIVKKFLVLSRDEYIFCLFSSVYESDLSSHKFGTLGHVCLTSMHNFFFRKERVILSQFFLIVFNCFFNVIKK